NNNGGHSHRRWAPHFCELMQSDSDVPGPGRSCFVVWEGAATSAEVSDRIWHSLLLEARTVRDKLMFAKDIVARSQNEGSRVRVDERRIKNEEKIHQANASNFALPST